MERRRPDTPDGAWFVAPRTSELAERGDGAAAACVVCGAEVWIDAGDAALAASCAAIACPDCTGTAHGILYIPPAEDPAAGGDPPALPHCSGCGEPVAPHDPAWLEEADGTVRPSSLRNFDEQSRRQAWRLWHVDCFTAERVDRS